MVWKQLARHVIAKHTIDYVTNEVRICMIKSVNYVADQETLICVETNDAKLKIKYSDLEPYWSYANPDDFEAGRASIQDDFLIFTMLVAGGQGGHCLRMGLQQQ